MSMAPVHTAPLHQQAKLAEAARLGGGPRLLPIRELRPGMTIMLAARSHLTAKLPYALIRAVGGHYGTVQSVSPYGDALRVVVTHKRALHPSGSQIFVADPTQNVIIRSDEVRPVPHTPMSWARLMGIAE